MPNKFIGFPKIGQFRDAIRVITDRSRYDGKDSEGNVKYNHNPLPKITFKGTVKLHGTNAGVTISKDGEVTAQSRERIIVPGDDNYGFASFVNKNKQIFLDIAKQIEYHQYDYITIFGEWCGSSIQNGVAIANLSKRFVIFDIRFSNEESESSVFMPDEELINFKNEENDIYNILDFPSYNVEIDFNSPEIIQNELISLTLKVEEECPFAKHFDVSGVGEGLVFSYQFEDYSKIRFKSKGVKHSSSKVKVIAAVNPERLESIQAFVDYSVTTNRLTQGYSLISSTKIPSASDIGPFIKWITNDIFTEELDTLTESNLTPKDVVSAISNNARNWFLKQLTLEN